MRLALFKALVHVGNRVYRAPVKRFSGDDMVKLVKAFVAFSLSAGLMSGCATAPEPETLEQASARISAYCASEKARLERHPDPVAVLWIDDFEEECACVAGKITQRTLNPDTSTFTGPQIPRAEGVLIADTLTQASGFNEGLEELEGKVSDVTLNHINRCFGK